MLLGIYALRLKCIIVKHGWVTGCWMSKSVITLLEIKLEYSNYVGIVTQTL